MRSVAEIQADLTAARSARTKVLTRGQSEGHDGASLSRASLADIRETIADLEAELNAARGCGGVTFTPTIGVAD